MIEIPEEIASIHQSTTSGLMEDVDKDIIAGVLPENFQDCISHRDVIIAELIDRESELPPGIKIYSCGYNSANDPHFWLEVCLDNGKILIWDQSQQKIKNNSFLLIEEAKELWPPYFNPDQKMQIIPLSSTI